MLERSGKVQWCHCDHCCQGLPPLVRPSSPFSCQLWRKHWLSSIDTLAETHIGGDVTTGLSWTTCSLLLASTIISNEWCHICDEQKRFELLLEGSGELACPQESFLTYSWFSRSCTSNTLSHIAYPTGCPTRCVVAIGYYCMYSEAISLVSFPDPQ